MATRSAGILPYRWRDGGIEVLLVHPGGPFWARKDFGAWSVAKGEYVEPEQAFDAALREFQEETGLAPRGSFIELAPLRQPSGKIVSAWAVELDWDPAKLVSNTFELEWPKGSGTLKRFPEADRAEWFAVPEAMQRILPGQRGFVEELARRLVRRG